MGVEIVHPEIIDPVIDESRRRIDQQAERRQAGSSGDNDIANARIRQITDHDHGIADLGRQRLGLDA